MLNILFFLLDFIFPGACLLWLLRAKWSLKPELKPGGSIWLAIPTSFALSVSIISLLGWAGFFLKLNFIEVKFIFYGIVSLLFLASAITLWQKRQEAGNNLVRLVSRKYSIRNLEFITAVFILMVFLLAIYGGTWFSHTADSFNHMAVVRSLVEFNNPIPMQIYWPDPVSGMDPTNGTWHLALAIWMSTAGIDLPTMWLLATVLLAPMIVLTFIVLALELTKEKPVAFLAGLFFVVVGISGDFRISAQPNRMGQIFLWLSIIFVVLSMRTSSEGKADSKWFYIILAAWLGWTSTAIHQQYAPALLGIVIPGLAIFYLMHVLRRSDAAGNSTSDRRLVIRQILYTGTAVLLSTLLGFIIRSSYTISEKYPLVNESIQALQTTSSLTVIQQYLRVWFSGWNSYITIATIFSMTLIYFLFRVKSRVKLEVIFIVVSSILVPLYVVFATIFIGRGGLVFSVFSRLTLLMPPMLIIGWVWVLVRVMRVIPTHTKDLSFRTIPTILLFDLAVIIISLYSISMRVNKPQGGIVSLYSPQSSYGYRFSISRNLNLFYTRGNAIQFINTIPDDARILADEGVSYEMAGITGKLFVRLPSQHTPLQEKDLNDAILQDHHDFVSGELTSSQMTEILLRHNINYIYVDRERYNGQRLWNILPTIPVLDEVASGQNWRIYQMMPEQAEAYILLDEKIRGTDDFFESITLMKTLEEMFPNRERYIAALQRFIPIDPVQLMDFVNEGPNYSRPITPGFKFDFLEHFDDAWVISGQSDSVKRTSYLINYDARGVIFQHPNSRLVYYVDIPPNVYLDFSIALAPDTWSPWKGDGVDFLITVEKNARQINIFNQYIDPKNRTTDRKWLDFSLDLTAYSGEKVKLIFETRSGPKLDDRYDWAGWGEPRLRIDLRHELFENWDYSPFQRESGR